MKKEYNWAVIGCGHIANEMAQAMKKEGKCFYAVSSRTYSNAADFAEKYGIEKIYDDIDEMLDDKNVDIVYISTPHNTHFKYIMKAIKNKKHVLCEKAITLNSDELSIAESAAKENNVVLAEAMTIYHMPVYKKLNDIISSGSLGALKQIQVNLGSNKDYDMSNRFFSRELAGGAMLDIGVYALSFVRMFMSQTPDMIDSQINLAPTGVDEQAGILLTNAQGEMAGITLSLCAKMPKRGTVSFEKGYIDIADYNRAYSACVVYNQSGETEIIKTDSSSDALFFEIEDMQQAVSGEENNMHLDYTVDVMDIMTKIRNKWGITYPEEE